MPKQRIWSVSRRLTTKPVAAKACVVLVVMSLLSDQLWVVVGEEAAGDESAPAAAAALPPINPLLDIRALCDQSVRNYRLLTPREADEDPDMDVVAESTATNRYCICKMVHEAPWGAAKIEIDCSALSLQNENVLAKNLPFGAQLLDVAWNSLTRVPEFKQNLEQLKIFRLNNNHIEKIQKADFSGYNYLDTLDLSNNAIETIEESAFDDLTALKHLNLAYNNLQTMPEYLFRTLTNIVHLTLSGNNLKDLLTHKNLYFNFELNARSLKVLELDYCQLAWLSLEAGESLVEVRLRGNAFFKELPLLPPNIKLLDLSANPVRRLDSTFYSGQLKQMEVLLLEDMPNLYILDISSMATFHQLRKLSLQNSKNFTYLHELAFDPIESQYQHNGDDYEDLPPQFTELNEIILTGTKVRKLSENLHEYIPSVEVIALDGCPMMCDCDLKWLMGKQKGIMTNGICEKPMSVKNQRIDDMDPLSIRNCSNFSRYMFKIINGFLILLMIVLVGVAMYFLVMGCRPSKKFYIRQRLGVNSPYSRITVEPLGQAYRQTTTGVQA